MLTIRIALVICKMGRCISTLSNGDTEPAQWIGELTTLKRLEQQGDNDVVRSRNLVYALGIGHVASLPQQRPGDHTSSAICLTVPSKHSMVGKLGTPCQNNR